MVEMPKAVRKLATGAALAAAAITPYADQANAQEAGNDAEPEQNAGDSGFLDKTTFSSTFSVKSDYMLEGITLDDELVMQNLNTASRGNFTLLSLLNYDPDATGAKDNLNEAHLFLNYAFSPTDDVDANVTGALSNIQFPTQNGREWKTTEQVELSLTLDDLLTISAGKDFDEGDGNYINAKVSETFDKGPVSVTPRAKLGHNDGFYISGDETYITPGADVAIELGDDAVLTFSGSYQKPLSPEEADGTNLEEKLYGSAGLTVNF